MHKLLIRYTYEHKDKVERSGCFPFSFQSYGYIRVYLLVLSLFINDIKIIFFIKQIISS